MIIWKVTLSVPVFYVFVCAKRSCFCSNKVCRAILGRKNSDGTLKTNLKSKLKSSTVYNLSVNKKNACLIHKLDLPTPSEPRTTMFLVPPLVSPISALATNFTSIYNTPISIPSATFFFVVYLNLSEYQLRCSLAFLSPFPYFRKELVL